MEDWTKLGPLAVEGRVTAQLFDSRTGRQVDEQSGKNFVSRALTERILRVAQRYAFAHQHPTQWDWCLWDRFTTTSDAQGFFQWMILTDSSMAESPATEREVPGVITGFSNRQTHSDVDLRRGIINRAECVHRDNQTKWVMDWATDRGNGTFQSVCWAYSSTGTTPLPDMLGTDSTLEWVSGRTESQICFYVGDYWVTVGGGAIVRLAAATGDVLFSRTVSPPPSSGENVMAVSGDFIFYVGSDVTLRRHTISTNTTSASLGAVSGAANLVIIGDIVYIFDYSDPGHVHATGATLTIRRYRISTSEFLTSLSIPSLPAGVNTRNTFPMGGNVIRVGPGVSAHGFYHDIDVETLTVTPLGVRTAARTYTARDGRVKAWVPSRGTTYVSTTMRPANGMLFDVSSMAGNFLLSRIRLAAPIVKTLERTLKVIYDFNYL